MTKSTLPQGIRTLLKWYEKNTLRFTMPIQRAGGQWQSYQKSLLIHSILGDYLIPPIYLVKYKEADETYYEALDGKQRVTSIFEFIEGQYQLHASTPSVLIDGEEYELANKSFTELSDEVQDLILGFRFTIYVVEDATNEEIEELFARLNSSTPLTLIQKARTVMGTELAEWTREITQMDFFNKAISFTPAQMRRESELEVVLQSMLLIDAQYEDYDYKGISMREVTKYCQSIRGNYDEGKREWVYDIWGYLSEAFTEKHKFLKKSNVPMVFVTADKAMDMKVEPADFKRFIDVFHANTPVAYEENTGSGNIKRVKTEGRINAMEEALKEFFGTEEVSSDTDGGSRDEPTMEEIADEIAEDIVVEESDAVIDQNEAVE